MFKTVMSSSRRDLVQATHREGPHQENMANHIRSSFSGFSRNSTGSIFHAKGDDGGESECTGEEWGDFQWSRNLDMGNSTGSRESLVLSR